MATPAEYTKCKTLGHSWEVIPYIGEIQFEYAQCIFVRCTSCHSTRLDTVNVYGELVGRRYEHSQGYKEVIRTNRASWRLELLRVNKLIRSRDNRRAAQKRRDQKKANGA